jgi:hypothetical protein
LPHEWLGIAFVAFGVYVLENLPVTYPRSALFLAYSVPVGLMSIIAMITLLILRRTRPSREIRELLLWTLRSLLLLALVMPVHFLLKSFIHLINPRVWDLQLFRIDNLLLFGYSPSIFFTHLFQNEALLGALDIVYSGIYYVLLVSHVGLLMILPSKQNRKAFVASYSSMWIVGMLLYLAFPSWGPVFVRSDLFEQCLAFMPRTVMVQSVLYEEISSLVRNPLGSRVIRFGCVAAFPSLHLSIVTLFALASRTVARRWFRINLVVGVLMFIGSIVTGYHYMIDSVAGVVLGMGLWFGWRYLYRNDAPLLPASGSSENR